MRPRAPAIPATTTAGELARILGRTERVVAGRKADGRLPVLPDGSIDLRAVIAAGCAALADRRGCASTSSLSPAEGFDAGLRMAASLTAHLLVSAAAEDPAADLGVLAARAIGDALGMCGIDPDPEAPIPARVVPLPGYARAGAEGVA